PRDCNRPSVSPVVKIRVISSSHEGPRKAKGARRAPELTPVTTLNSGRDHLVVEPANAPAPKAPLEPPLDRASTLRGRPAGAARSLWATSADERRSNSPLASSVRTEKARVSDSIS